MSTVRLLPRLYLVSAGLTAVVLGPLLGTLFGVGPRYLLYRDAVSTPRSYVTDAALGIGELPPRAVPQDWFVAIGSRIVDGGWLVIAILVAALVCAGVGYGRLAHRLVPSAGATGAVGAAVIAIWNPYVAERLLQGHWSLLVGYSALGWIIVAVMDLRPPLHPEVRGAQATSLEVLGDAPRQTLRGWHHSHLGDREGLRAKSPAVRWCQLGGLLAAAGLTPTGSLFAAAILVTMCAGCRFGVRRSVGLAAIWVASAAPWLMAAALGTAGATSGAAGVSAFALRSEPWLGPLGTAAGLSGIWNADAVPAGRTIGWAAAATACLLVVVVTGTVHLLRTPGVDAAFRRLTALAMITLILVMFSTFGPGQAFLEWAVQAIPGAGMLRDGQKFLALLMPAYAVAGAGALGLARRYLPAGFALTALALLVVAPLPDLGWGVGGHLRPVDYPVGWTTIADIVPADAGAVALWPSDTVRRYGFTDSVSLDPASRLLRAPVVETGRLTVDGREIDPAVAGAAEIQRTLATPGDPSALGRLGVGWVLVEGTTPAPARVTMLLPTFSGDSLRLFRINGAQTAQAGAGARISVTAAHLWWALMLGVGACAAVFSGRVDRKRRENRRRSLPTNSHPT